MRKIRIVANKGRNNHYAPEVVMIIKADGLNWGLTKGEAVHLRAQLSQKLTAMQRQWAKKAGRVIDRLMAKASQGKPWTQRDVQQWLSHTLASLPKEALLPKRKDKP